MRIQRSTFRSKLAQRIFLMFVACALLPIVSLFVISYNQVNGQLEQQGHVRLKQAVKAHGVSIYERLLFLETDLKILSSLSASRDGTPTDAEHTDRLRERFTGIALLPPDGLPMPLMGAVGAPPSLEGTQRQHIAAGNTVVSIQPGSGRWPQVFMIRLASADSNHGSLLAAEIAPEYLWTNWDQNALPPDIDFCVLDQRRNLLFSTIALGSTQIEALSAAASDVNGWHQKIRNGERTMLVCCWNMFLKPQFMTGDWTVAVLLPEAEVMAPVAHFKYIFGLVTAMTLMVVLLLSIKMIRRNLTPLEKIIARTERIAAKDFSSRLEIRSGDEFEEVANAFNDMSAQLNRQFNTLLAKSEIDRAILSSIETDRIVRVVLTGMRACLAFDAVSIALLAAPSDQKMQIYTGQGSLSAAIRTTQLHLSPAERKQLEHHPDHLILSQDHDLPAYLGSMTTGRHAGYLVLPIFLEKQLAAIIAFASRAVPSWGQEDIDLARQMADQVAVALRNSQLMAELNRLNWGTIKAFARAVDAKSSWTAGHSERVASMAVAIGRSMQLPQQDLETLKRAGLLHDIGKLGVPLSILDKPGRLDAEEYRVIQRHPGLGARILQPINAYADIIPLVLHHHERYDGGGYPSGIAGGRIELGARILAAADVFDALKSDRPYRRGMPMTQVVGILRAEAGKHFDPAVVDALLASIDRNEPVEGRAASRQEAHRALRYNQPNLKVPANDQQTASTADR